MVGFVRLFDFLAVIQCRPELLYLGNESLCSNDPTSVLPAIGRYTHRPFLLSMIFEAALAHFWCHRIKLQIHLLLLRPMMTPLFDRVQCKIQVLSQLKQTKQSRQPEGITGR